MKLRKYTVADSFSLHLELKGAACTVRQNYGGPSAQSPKLLKGLRTVAGWGRHWQVVDMPWQLQMIWYLPVSSLGLKAGGYPRSCCEVGYSGQLRNIELLSVRQRSKKKNYITGNIDLIRKNIIDTDEDISRHFHMYVIDNKIDVSALSSERSLLP